MTRFCGDSESSSSEERLILLRYAFTGDPDQGVVEVELLARRDLIASCVESVATKRRVLDLIEGVDWSSVVADGATSTPTTLDEAQPELMGKLEQHAAEKETEFTPAQKAVNAASRAHAEEEDRARLHFASPEGTHSDSLRGQAATATAKSWLFGLAECGGIVMAVLSTTGGVLDYASFFDVPTTTLVSQGLFGIFCALAFVGVQRRLMSATRQATTPSRRLYAVVALAFTLLLFTLATSIVVLRLGSLSLADGAAVVGEDVLALARALLLFGGSLALVERVGHYADTADTLSARADAAARTEEEFAARIKAAKEGAVDAQTHLDHVELVVGAPGELRMLYATDVCAFRTRWKIGQLEVEQRTMAFRSALADLRALSVPVRERRVAAMRAALWEEA